MCYLHKNCSEQAVFYTDVLYYEEHLSLFSKTSESLYSVSTIVIPTCPRLVFGIDCQTLYLFKWSMDPVAFALPSVMCNLSVYVYITIPVYKSINICTCPSVTIILFAYFTGKKSQYRHFLFDLKEVR